MVRDIFLLSLLTGFGVAVPVNDGPSSSIQHSIVKRGQATASVVATLQEGVEWLIPIQVGNKTFNVQLDTGSADLWLFCTEGPQNIESGHDLYNPSTGTKLDGATFDITYGSGFAKGDVYMDKVTIGGITTSQAIECATDMDSNDASDHTLDGILGVGFNSGSSQVNNGYPEPASATQTALNSVTTQGGGILGLMKSAQPDPQMTLMENIFPQLLTGLFTADLNYKGSGVYNFGYIDQARFSTPITYMPVRDFNYWIVDTSGYKVGNNAAQSTSWKALIDTGTTDILLSPSTTVDYFSAAPKAQLQSPGVYTVPCDPTTAALPDLTITFTPPAPVAPFIQPGSTCGINTQPYNAVVPGEYLIGNPTGKNDGMCQAAIGNVGSGEPWDVILGDVFLMSQLVVFDVGDLNGSVDSNYPSHGQIGFAPKPANTTTA